MSRESISNCLKEQQYLFQGTGSSIELKYNMLYLHPTLQRRLKLTPSLQPHPAAHKYYSEEQALLSELENLRNSERKNMLLTQERPLVMNK